MTNTKKAAAWELGKQAKEYYQKISDRHSEFDIIILKAIDFWIFMNTPPHDVEEFYKEEPR